MSAKTVYDCAKCGRRRAKFSPWCPECRDDSGVCVCGAMPASEHASTCVDYLFAQANPQKSGLEVARARIAFLESERGAAPEMADLLRECDETDASQWWRAKRDALLASLEVEPPRFPEEGQ